MYEVVFLDEEKNLNRQVFTNQEKLDWVLSALKENFVTIVRSGKIVRVTEKDRTEHFEFV